ncbi:MAG: bifunctional oligoribonuclease/PAP phosphatase NrnA [Desulfobacterales bacterium]|jgi:phosphoesterase RecJ-like protein|nr:bifunctional oligoribonuclease/PAP phosphatase NrnA [Desulfobacterales bacterium]
MDSIISQIKNSHRIVVISHTNPDGDAIGSLIATGLSLKALNKKTTLYNESPIPAVYRFLPKVHQVVRKLDKTDYDLAIVLDCSNLERIGTAVSVVNRIPLIVNIDHHITNTHFGHIQLIDTSACATSEIVYWLIKKMNIPLDKFIATAIYTGILTDTGSFRFSNTNKAAFAICREMLDLGVDPYDISQHVYGTYSLGRIKLLNLALDSIEISNNGKVSIMTLTKDMFVETHTQPEDGDGLINYAKRIQDIKVAALIQEHHNGNGPSEDHSMYHVSLRSDGSVDVATIASTFGGGGHSSAAGFNIESTLSEIKTIILNLANTM